MCAKKKRRFIPMECNHVYQRGASGFNIFYDREDFLVCYMILSVVAQKRNVKIVEMCFMFDHVHIHWSLSIVRTWPPLYVIIHLFSFMSLTLL